VLALLERAPFNLSFPARHCCFHRALRRQPPHRACRVELLGHRDERHTVRIKDLDQLSNIRQRTGQPIDLVHDHDVGAARPNVGQQALQCRPLMLPPENPPSS
jgi:hypothetical protein